VLSFVLLAPLIVEQKPPVSIVPEKPPALTVPYGSAGSMELAGWVGTSASGGSIQGQAGALVGWFFFRGFELSGIVGMEYVHPGGEAEVSASMVVEPSVHVPLGSGVLGFTGLGGGVTLSSAGFGFELAPRVGVNVLFGRGRQVSVLTLALTLTYETNAPTMSSLGATVAYGLAW
jgi:hypothetical protein